MSIFSMVLVVVLVEVEEVVPSLRRRISLCLFCNKGTSARNTLGGEVRWWSFLGGHSSVGLNIMALYIYGFVGGRRRRRMCFWWWWWSWWLRR